MALQITLLIVTGVVNGAVFIRLLYTKHPRGTLWGLAAAGLVILASVAAVILVTRNRARLQQAEWDRRKVEHDAARQSEADRQSRLTPNELAMDRKSRIDRALHSYFSDHGRYPAFLWNDLTRPTDSSSYLSGALENPLNHSFTVVWPGFASPTDGWEYDAEAGRVWPLGLPHPPPAPQSRP